MEVTRSHVQPPENAVSGPQHQVSQPLPSTAGHQAPSLAIMEVKSPDRASLADDLGEKGWMLEVFYLFYSVDSETSA